MGMAASQVRFLQLTSRKHDISRELQHLSMEKMSLTRDMHNVTKDYQKALSSKTIKWSNNAGVSYTDVDYNILMRPNSANMKSPVLVSDSSGKIVLDKEYQKYAEMLDAAGGKWSGDIKNKILAELTGISQADIDAADSTSAAVVDSINAYNDALEDLDVWSSKEVQKAGTEYLSIDKLAKKLGTVNGADLAKLYARGSSGGYSIRSAQDVKTLAEGIKNNMSKYFVDDDTYLHSKDKTAFEEACKLFEDTYSALVNDDGNSNASVRKIVPYIKAGNWHDSGSKAALPNNDTNSIEKQRENFGFSGESGDWTLDVSQVFKFIMSAYVQKMGTAKKSSSTQELSYPVRYTDTAAWNSWYEGLQSRTDKLAASKKDYESNVNIANQVMTADQEAQLNYYDLLFQAIADNGWTTDSQIEDSEYLSQMFQNNSYYVTTITENKSYDSSMPLSDRNYQYDYDTHIASNFDKMYLVNDSDVRNEALVDYEYKKGIINAKESRIDTRMKNLETEQSAISKMLESIDQVKNDNIERTFGIWG